MADACAAHAFAIEIDLADDFHVVVTCIGVGFEDCWVACAVVAEFPIFADGDRADVGTGEGVEEIAGFQACE